MKDREIISKFGLLSGDGQIILLTTESLGPVRSAQTVVLIHPESATMRSLIRFICALAILAVCSAQSNAEFAIINTYDRGHYNNNGLHNEGDYNYETGQSDLYHSFFAFDLTGITGNVVITEAHLLLYNPATGYAGEPGSSETLTIYDYTSSIDSLSSAHGNGETGDAAGVAIFQDLGSGSVPGSNFGTQNVSSDANSTPGIDKYVRIDLNAAALSALNSALNNAVNKKIVFGGSLGVENTVDNYVFGDSGTSNPADGRTTISLTTTPLASIATPEPASLLTLGAGFIGLAGFVRRRNRRAAAAA